MNTPTPTAFEYGHAARLRAARDYLGLGQCEMADQLGVAARSYERWEGGQSGIPMTVWNEIAALQREQDRAVQAFVSRWITAADDGADHLLVPDFLTKWERTVVARACRVEPRIVVKFQDDLDAVAKDSSGDQVPEPSRIR